MWSIIWYQAQHEIKWYYQQICLSFCTPEESLKCKEVNFLFSMMLIVMTRKWLLSMNFANKNIVIITEWYANYHHSHTQLFKFLKYCVSPEKRFKYLILLSSCFQYTPQGIICVSTISASVLRFQLTWESMWYPYFYENLQQ